MRERVEGKAMVGDIVRYEDAANPPRCCQVVKFRPTIICGGIEVATSDYQLRSANGDVRFSDLRQHGWTFASEVEAVEYYDEAETSDATLKLLREVGLTV